MIVLSEQHWIWLLSQAAHIPHGLLYTLYARPAGWFRSICSLNRWLRLGVSAWHTYNFDLRRHGTSLDVPKRVLGVTTALETDSTRSEADVRLIRFGCLNLRLFQRQG